MMFLDDKVKEDKAVKILPKSTWNDKDYFPKGNYLDDDKFRGYTGDSLNLPTF